MTDLSDRLRKWESGGPTTDSFVAIPVALRDEAADRIAELEAAIRKHRDDRHPFDRPAKADYTLWAVLGGTDEE